MTSLEILQLYPQHKATMSGLLDSRTQIKKKDVFLYFDQKREWTWGAFSQWVSSTAQLLQSRGVKSRDRVVVVAPNHDASLSLFFALADLGAIFVPLNPDLSDSDYKYLLTKTKPQSLYTTHVFKQKLSTLCNELKLNCEVYDLHEIVDLELISTPLSHQAQENDTSLILFTSGTTGFPKGAMHSQQNAVIAGEAFVERMLLTPQDRLFCILPFFHINALFYSLMGSVTAGASLIVSEKFSASKFWQVAADLKATEVNIIAAIGKILSQRDRKEFRPDHTIKKVYGAPVSIDIENVFTKDFKIPTVIEGYGMTEIPGAINNRIGVQHKTGTMGVAALHPDHSRLFTQLRIVDDNGLEVKRGQEGELIVKTPIVMQGYFDDEEQTKNAFTQDGWFRTGDIVKQDKDGFYIFVARKKDIIRKKGENISGAEIDRVVERCPGILEAAAVGVPSDLGEEDILLVYVCKEPGTPRPQEVHNWCEQNLARMKVPTFFLELKSLPHTPTARIAKHKISRDIQGAWKVT